MATMKILVAPNALKGSCTAATAAQALARGLRRVDPTAEIVELPVADGGDGLLEVALRTLGAERRTRTVTGPRFAPVEAAWAWQPERRTAILEMALASGLALLTEGERDATATTTLGTGELLRAALDLGAETLRIGLGGSATCDGGLGMATALGYRFLDAAGKEVPPVGGRLGDLCRIDATGADPRLGAVRVEALCDVTNPLTGPRGAAAVYGPQKGASPEQVRALDAGLEKLATILARDLGQPLRDLPGAGAAGGLGAGLVAFCGARLRPGAEAMLDLVEFDAHLAGADLVLTAEGRLDAQTRQGKAPGAVGRRAQRRGVPCIALAGDLGEDLESLQDSGIVAAVSLCPGPRPLAEAQARAEEWLADTAERTLRIFLAGGGRRPAPDPGAGA